MQWGDSTVLQISKVQECDQYFFVPLNEYLAELFH